MDDSTEMRHPEYQYLDLLQELLDHGDKRMDARESGTLALFGRQMRFDLSESFPILTTKRVYWKTAFKEMLWMLSGGTNIRELLEQNVHGYGPTGRLRSTAGRPGRRYRAGRIRGTSARRSAIRRQVGRP